ncbi:MAG: hypothetical protein WDN03_08170 [Rhizomicrobium sp.]
MTVDEMVAAQEALCGRRISLHSIRWLLGGEGGNDINTMLLGLPRLGQGIGGCQKLDPGHRESRIRLYRDLA